MNNFAQEIIQGNIGAVARAITRVENREQHSLALLDQLYRTPRISKILGITGAPGSGKSTFTNQLVNHLAQEKNRIAVVAVDPTSSFTGGALLGDRVRFSDQYSPHQVFYRSMASQWSHSGVPPSLFHVLQILNAAKFDWILVESVGAGQNDMEIGHYVQNLVLLLVGGMGDDIQCMKAGIMEIADIFIINKIDIHNATALHLALNNTLDCRMHDRILQSDSLHNVGFDKIIEKLNSLFEDQKYRERNIANDTRLLLSGELELFFSQKKMEQRLQKLLPEAGSPYQILQKIENLLERLLEDLT